MFTLIIEDKYGAIVDEYSFEDGEFVIGRSQSCDIVLAADNVSRRHGRLFTVDGRCYVEDLKAANGVWLNGKRIYNVTELPRSAQVRIGDFYLHIEGAAFARPMGPSTFANLVPVHGGNESFELNRQTTLIGRGKDCTLVINDPSVSRIHTKITQDDEGRVMVEDLRSSNGTYVNERRVDVQGLRHGDRVRFGTVGFIYQVEGEELASVPAPAEWSEQPQSQSAFRPAAPISSYGEEYPSFYDGPKQPERPSMLPQVAAVAVIILAITGLVVIVGFAYDRWVSPAITARQVASKKVTTKAAAKRQVNTLKRKRQRRKKRYEQLMERGREAMNARQWDKAERAYKEARRLDPTESTPTKALNRIAGEKKAGARFVKAEAAFAKKSYAEAIRQHHLIPQGSVYRADADAALKAIAGVLEIDGDTACKADDTATCKARYSLALSTKFASQTLEDKFAQLLKAKPKPAKKKKRSSRRRRRR
ncbi:MAG: FHA domain-containing protein [Myxococcales bacterium]|nr:FHA domain-containing protein [Myxococcales bacterium]